MRFEDDFIYISKSGEETTDGRRVFFMFLIFPLSSLFISIQFKLETLILYQDSDNPFSRVYYQHISVS